MHQTRARGVRVIVRPHRSEPMSYGAIFEGMPCLFNHETRVTGPCHEQPQKQENPTQGRELVEGVLRKMAGKVATVDANPMSTAGIGF